MSSRFFWALALATVVPILAIPLLKVMGLLHHDTIWPAASFLIGVGGAHIASTLWFHVDSSYGPVRQAHPWRMWGALFAIPAALVAASLIWPPIMTPLLAAYLAWQAHHYSRQNFGVLSFASAYDKAGKLPASVNTFVNTTTLIGAPAMMTWAQAFGVQEPFGWWGSTPVIATAMAVSVGAAVISFAMLVRLIVFEPAIRRSPTLLTFLILTWVFFLPALTAIGTEGAFLPYAVAHGMQYLVFMAVTSGRSRFGLAGVAIMLGGTVGAMILAGQLPPVLYAPVWTGLVIWHFVADARLWRMSDPAVRSVVAKRFDFVFKGRQPKPVLAPAE